MTALKKHGIMVPKTWTFNLRYTGSPGTREKIIRDANIIGQHVNLCIRHVKQRQIIMQVAKTDSTRKPTPKPYTTHRDPTYGLKTTDDIIYVYFWNLPNPKKSNKNLSGRLLPQLGLLATSAK